MSVTRVNQMKYKNSMPDAYTHCTATLPSNHVLNILAAEQRKPVYAVLDEVLRREFPEYFRKIEIRC